MAPGLPDQIASDGARVGWTQRGALCLLQGDVVFVPRFDMPIESATPFPEAWVLNFEYGIWRGDPSTGEGSFLPLDLLDEDSRFLMGSQWGVLTQGARNQVLAAPGAPPPPPLPAGALRSPILLPWSGGVGLLWVDDAEIFRLSLGGAPRNVGNLSFRVDALSSGPQGSAVVLGADELMCLSAGGVLVDMEEAIDLESLRFSTDGLLLLAAVADGVALFDLSTGRILQRWEGALLPVGFAPGPLLLDENTGWLIDSERKLLQGGFSLSAPARWRDRLLGPGGRLWDLGQGVSVGHPLPFTAEQSAAGERGFLTADEQTVHWLDREGQEEAHWPNPFASSDLLARSLALPDDDSGEDDSPSRELIESLAWTHEGRALILSTEGRIQERDPSSGEMLEQAEISELCETEGWRLLEPGPTIVFRDGDKAMFWPSRQILPAPEQPVEALLATPTFIYRASGDRVEARSLSEETPSWKTDGLELRLLALGRFLYGAEADDLLILDPRSGEARDRIAEGALGVGRIEVLEDGNLACLGAPEEAPLVQLREGRRGRLIGEWPLPADGAATVAGVLYLWTDDGSLVGIKRPAASGATRP